MLLLVAGERRINMDTIIAFALGSILGGSFGSEEVTFH